MKAKFTTTVLATLLAASCSMVHAKEGGDQYPNGAESWMSGALPPPGNYFLNYLGAYSGKLKNGDGDNTNIAGRTPEVNAVFDALRFVKVTDKQILGASWGMQAIVPLVHQSIDFPQLGGRNSTTGLGDITVDPIVLGWHGPNWHVTAGLDIYLPTGKYDKNDPRVSIGTHYWSVEPVVAATWLSEGGWEASAKLMYNIKGKNTDSNFGGVNGTYQSGDEFHTDFAVGKHVGPWIVGLSGYYLKQVSDDKFNDAAVPAVPGLWSQGRRGEVLALGPSVAYSTKNGTTFIAQWQHEVEVKNRFGGDALWFKLVTPF